MKPAGVKVPSRGLALGRRDHSGDGMCSAAGAWVPKPAGAVETSSSGVWSCMCRAQPPLAGMQRCITLRMTRRSPGFGSSGAVLERVAAPWWCRVVRVRGCEGHVPASRGDAGEVRV